MDAKSGLAYLHLCTILQGILASQAQGDIAGLKVVSCCQSNLCLVIHLHMYISVQVSV